MDVLNPENQYFYVTLEIYHIGLEGYGRLGFEHLVEIAANGPADAEVVGVVSRDGEKLEDAEKFAAAHDMEVQTFSDVHEMYDDASEEDGNVFVYDTGSSDTHSDNLYRSLQHGFYHLAERPPSIKRREHLRERKLSEESSVTWKVDFIERENPAVKKAAELLQDEDIESIRTYRYSSEAVEAALMPEKRHKLRGGTVLNQAINEVYILDFLEAAEDVQQLEIESASVEYFTPFSRGSEKMMAIDGGYVKEIGKETAEADFNARYSAGAVDVEMNSGMLGISEKGLIEAADIAEVTGHDFRHRNFIEAEGEAFIDERAAFFIVEGSRKLAGDLVEGKLFDLETGEEIETDYLLHTPLYRVIEDAVLEAAGEEENTLEVETDTFMEALYDARDELSGGDYMDELDKANTRLENMIVEDKETNSRGAELR